MTQTPATSSRRPYQAPELVTLDLKATRAGAVPALAETPATNASLLS